VPILVLGLPARYVHSHYNFCYVSDIEETIKLAINIIKNLSNENLDTIYRKNLLNCKCSITECLE
jgi:putative aminopeptidase FrvX